MRAGLSALLMLAVTAACAGCADDEARVARDELPRVVLQPADLGRIWVRFDEGRQIGPDAPPEPRADPNRFGRVEGWKARFRRPGSPSTKGPLVIESRADLFGDVDGAESDFELVELDPAEGLEPAKELEAPGLGDESVAVTFSQGEVTFVVISWRQANVVASLRANGFADSFTSADALELARKQGRRLARAVES